jgi:hypothetical protein
MVIQSCLEVIYSGQNAIQSSLIVISQEHSFLQLRHLGTDSVHSVSKCFCDSVTSFTQRASSQLSSQVASLHQFPRPYSQLKTIQRLVNHQSGQSMSQQKSHRWSWLLSAARLAITCKVPHKYLQVHRFLVRVYSLRLNTALTMCSLAALVEPSGSSNEYTQMNLYLDWQIRTLAPAS